MKSTIKKESMKSETTVNDNGKRPFAKAVEMKNLKGREPGRTGLTQAEIMVESTIARK
jgi:hypothetical protein